MIYKNECFVYVLYRIVNYAFDQAMSFSKVVHEPTKVSELVRPIFSGVATHLG